MNLRDITELLDRIPVWRKIKELPSRFTELEARVAALEARLEGAKGDVCPKCRQPTFKLIGSEPDPTFGVVGLIRRRYECSSCQYEESKQVDTLKD